MTTVDILNWGGRMWSYIPLWGLPMVPFLPLEKSMYNYLTVLPKEVRKKTGHDKLPKGKSPKRTSQHCSRVHQPHFRGRKQRYQPCKRQ